MACVCPNEVQFKHPTIPFWEGEYGAVVSIIIPCLAQKSLNGLLTYSLLWDRVGQQWCEISRTKVMRLGVRWVYACGTCVVSIVGSWIDGRG